MHIVHQPALTITWYKLMLHQYIAARSVQAKCWQLTDTTNRGAWCVWRTSQDHQSSWPAPNRKTKLIIPQTITTKGTQENNKFTKVINRRKMRKLISQFSSKRATESIRSSTRSFICAGKAAFDFEYIVNKSLQFGWLSHWEGRPTYHNTGTTYY